MISKTSPPRTRPDKKRPPPQSPETGDLSNVPISHPSDDDDSSIIPPLIPRLLPPLMVASITMWDNDATLLPNAAIGDILSVPKDLLTTRLHFQNLDGVSVSQGGSWDIVCDHWKRMEVDIALVAEHQLDTTKRWVQSKLHEGARKTYGLNNYTLQVGSTPISSPTAYKPGGTMAMAIGRVKGRILEMGSDELGRWVYIKFQRLNESPLSIICTYQVVDGNPKNAGPTTYVTQLYASYSSQGRSDPHKL